MAITMWQWMIRRRKLNMLLLQATVCAKFGLKCIVYMGKKVNHTLRVAGHSLTSFAAIS